MAGGAYARHKAAGTLDELRARQAGSHAGHEDRRQRLEEEQHTRTHYGESPNTMTFSAILLEFWELAKQGDEDCHRAEVLSAEMNRRCPADF